MLILATPDEFLRSALIPNSTGSDIVRELTADMFVSLDGFAGGPDGGQDYYETSLKLTGSSVIDSDIVMLEYRPEPPTRT